MGICSGEFYVCIAHIPLYLYVNVASLPEKTLFYSQRAAHPRCSGYRGPIYKMMKDRDRLYAEAL